MNFDNKGKKVATVVNKKNKKKSKDLYVDFNPDDKSLFYEYTCKPDEYMQQVPMPTSESKRNILYICGASGSGKSYYATEYLKQYNKEFPDNKIYFFSGVDNDFGKGLKNFKKIRICQELLNLELSMDDFRDCMVVYDDIDVIRDKAMRAKLWSISDRILQVGRHHNTSMIFTNHLPYDGKSTKMILNESHTITYPALLGGKGRKYLLENYIGLDNDDIKRLKSLPTRMITYIKGNPPCVIHERGALILGRST